MKGVWHPLVQTTASKAKAVLLRARTVLPDLNLEGAAKTKDGRSSPFSDEALIQVAACVDWIGVQQIIQSFNTASSSYGYKHDVERWIEKRGGPHLHVANGSFIAAAVGLGLEWKAADRLNLYFKFSKRSPKESRER
jgi:hypothetical protein